MIVLHSAVRSWFRYLYSSVHSALQSEDCTPAGVLARFYQLVVGLQYAQGGWLPKTVIPFSELDLVRSHVLSLLEQGVVTLTPPVLRPGQVQRLAIEYGLFFLAVASLILG